MKLRIAEIHTENEMSAFVSSVFSVSLRLCGEGFGLIDG